LLTLVFPICENPHFFPIKNRKSKISRSSGTNPNGIESSSLGLRAFCELPQVATRKIHYLEKVGSIPRFAHQRLNFRHPPSAIGYWLLGPNLAAG
jgi:hypothetical protein